MGITPTGLSQHINGNPTVGVLERIAGAIGCDISELFDSVAVDELTALVQYTMRWVAKVLVSRFVLAWLPIFAISLQLFGQCLRLPVFCYICGDTH